MDFDPDDLDGLDPSDELPTPLGFLERLATLSLLALALGTALAVALALMRG